MRWNTLFAVVALAAMSSPSARAQSCSFGNVWPTLSTAQDCYDVYVPNAVELELRRSSEAIENTPAATDSLRIDLCWTDLVKFGFELSLRNPVVEMRALDPDVRFVAFSDLDAQNGYSFFDRVDPTSDWESMEADEVSASEEVRIEFQSPTGDMEPQDPANPDDCATLFAPIQVPPMVPWSALEIDASVDASLILTASTGVRTYDFPDP